MSWSAIYEVDKGEWTTVQAPNVEKNYEHTEQHNAALTVASKIIESGVVGARSGKYRISIGGHGNPGNKPAPGWSNDSLTINIYQLDKE